ncbi:MAG: DUF4910 domain-containing protein [Saccharofermentanales bacterium]
MKEEIQTISSHINADRILNDVREITTFHRIQASTGYRQAAEHLIQKLQKEGIDCQLLSYPFDEERWYLSIKSFLEWDCQGAWLDLVEPEHKRLADFQANSISIIQKSFPYDFSEEPLDIVLLDHGPEEENYKDLDLKGKLIFIRDDFTPYMDWAFKERGAIGIISDYMREVEGSRVRADLYDVRNYSSFWWRDSKEEPNIFGFVLTPRLGDELARHCKQMEEDYQKDKTKPRYPKATGKVDTRLYPGHIEVIEVLLEGQEEEEILVVSHLCHPRPSANDNASGVASSLEMVRTLKHLLEQKKLDPLQRSIRLILVPEFAGTYAWLDDKNNQNKKILAGFNLDMVGGRQTEGYGPLTICSQPHASPSMVTAMADFCINQIAMNAPSINLTEAVPMFNYFISDFSAGSDHQILSDPTINIPTPMLGQWPDKHYHTSADTVEGLDPFILRKSASLAAAFTYSIANLKPRDTLSVLGKILEASTKDFNKICSEAIEEKREAGETFERFEHFAHFHKESCRDIKRFFKTEIYKKKLEQTVEDFCLLIDQQKGKLFNSYLKISKQKTYEYIPEVTPEEYSTIPQRKFKSPILRLEEFASHDPELLKACKDYKDKQHKRVKNAYTLELLIQYYMDSKRSLYEIGKQVMIEAGEGDMEFVAAYVGVLEEMGLLE